MGGVSVQLTAAFALTCLAGALMLAYAVSAQVLEQRVRCRNCGGHHRTSNCNRG
jgi:hypothetical protein